MPQMSNKITAGILVGAVDVLIYQHFVPRVADVRTAEPFNPDIENAERKALIAASIFTLLVAGLARSAEIFAIGGLAIIGVDFAMKHANAVSPATGKMAYNTPVEDNTQAYPMPDYTVGGDGQAA